MNTSNQHILNHYKTVEWAEYSLKLIESIRWTNSIDPEHFYIGVGYQNACSTATDKTEDYYEIIDGQLQSKYYTTNCNWRFETPRTPHNTEQVMQHTHLLFFSLNQLKDAIASATQQTGHTPA